jgi:hypothetical protein
LSLSPSQIALSQNATQKVQVQVIPQNGFSGSVTVTATGLPSGVTDSPSSVAVSVGSPKTLVFAAASNAITGTAQVSITGASGSLQAKANLGLDVIQTTATPIAVPFTTTGGNIVKAFYDESRQLLFASNLFLNEVDVLSGKDLSVQARIPIGQPFGIDQMPDGHTLVVGTFTQSFYTIDENTLAVTQYLAPNLSQANSTTVLLTPVVMANGNVLFMGKDMGVNSGSIFVYGGQYIIEWDSTTDVFSLVMSFAPAGEIDNLKRSADHNWAVFAADKLYIYSSATDSFVSSVDPIRSAPYGVRDIAANPNGSQFAVVSAYSVSFYDGAFNPLGTASVAETGLGFQHYNTQYSSDGSLLYWELASAGSVVDVLDTSSFTEVGYIISDFGPQTQFEPDLLWVGNAQQAFLATLGGVGLLDCSSPRTDTLNFEGPVGPDPLVIPLNETVPVTLSGLLPGTSVTFGGQLAPIESTTSNGAVVQVPASPVAGPVNLVFTQPDGETFSEPQNFIYGVDVEAPTSTLVPPFGNPVMGLFGFGMLNGPSTPPAVTVGGQGTNVAVNPEANYILQEIFLQLPNGTPGPADITVTGNNGTGTLKAAVTYIPSATIIPASGLLQLLYDTHRSLLYVLQSTQIQVLNPTSLQWESPLLPGGSGGVGYAAMALTPDGTQMLVLDAAQGTITVFDPDDPSLSTSTLLTSAGAMLHSVAVTNKGKAFIGSLNRSPIEFDLATNTYITPNTPDGLVKFVATPDGSYTASADGLSTFGTIATWHGAGTPTTQGFSGVIWEDVAISPDGSHVAALEGNLSLAGVAAGFFDGALHFTNATVYPDLAPPDQPFCNGAIFSASGLTLLSPLGDSIDFFKVQTATLRGRLLTPEPLPVGNATSGVIALDPNQQTIYAISASGLSVLTLPSVVDQITPFPWPYVAKPSHSVPIAAEGRFRTIHAMSQ